MFVKLIKYSIRQKLVPQVPQNFTSSKCIYSTIAATSGCCLCCPAVLSCASKLKESVAIFWSTGAISPLLSTGENNDAVILTAQLLHLFASKHKGSVEERGRRSFSTLCLLSCSFFAKANPRHVGEI